MEDVLRYAGFWRRVAASLIDSLLLVVVLIPLLLVATRLGLVDTTPPDPANPAAGADLGPMLLQELALFALLVFFWVRYGATPGKQFLDCRIVDLRTGTNPSAGRAILRYFGYIVDVLTLGLGFLWIVWDRRKQGFHDKIAGTVVIHSPERGRFDDESRKPLDQLIKEAS